MYNNISKVLYPTYPTLKTRIMNLKGIVINKRVLIRALLPIALFCTCYAMTRAKRMPWATHGPHEPGTGAWCCTQPPGSHGQPMAWAWPMSQAINIYIYIYIYIYRQ